MNTVPVSIEVSAGSDKNKSWPAGKFNVDVRKPTNEQEFKEVSGGVSSFDFAVSQYEKKATNAATSAFKNQKDAAVDVRISKATEAASNYTLGSRGEGVRTLANAAEAYLASISDPAARAAMEALIAKAKAPTAKE